MREIFDYINTNSFLTTIIGVIVGGFISSATSIYLSSKDLKERRKDEARRENERKYENKAEFKLEKVVEMGTEKPTLEAFLVPYRYEYTNDFKKCEIIYPEDIKEKTKYKYIHYYLKNIGNSDVNELALCAIFKEHNMLLEYNGLDFAIEKGIVNSSIYDEMKVQKDETIMIRVYYLCLPYFLCGIMDVMVGLLRGLGKSLVPMIVSIIGVVGFRIMWIYVVFYNMTTFENYQDLKYLYVSYPISWIATFIIQTIMFLIAYKKIIKKHKNEILVQ